MAQGLHSEMAWEELAEDPFRGLRAGPATFSPFLFPPISKSLDGIPPTVRRLKMAISHTKQRRARRRESEKNKAAL